MKLTRYCLLTLLISRLDCLRQLAYTSATSMIDPPDSVLQDILVTSRKHNKVQGITGILLYRDNHFLQILEGEERDVENTIFRITKDWRHKYIIILYNVEIEKRDLFDWTMASRMPNHTPELAARLQENDFAGYIEDPAGLHHKLSRKAQLLLITFERLLSER